MLFVYQKLHFETDDRSTSRQSQKKTQIVLVSHIFENGTEHRVCVCVLAVSLASVHIVNLQN